MPILRAGSWGGNTALCVLTEPLHLTIDSAPLMDAALITAAQRVEHHEIAAHGSVHAFATLMGEDDARSLLEQTLQEEKETDEKLTRLSQQIDQEAFQGRKEPEREETGTKQRAGSCR